MIGQINFGPTAEASFLRGQIAMQAMQITDLEAEVHELIAQRDHLRSLLQTDPKNLHPPQEKPLP